MLLFADVWMIVIWVHVLDYFHSKLCQEEKHFLNSPPTPYKIKFATSNNKCLQNIFTFLGNGNFHVSIHSALDVHILFTIWKINVHINLRLLHMFYDSIWIALASWCQCWVEFDDYYLPSIDVDDSFTFAKRQNVVRRGNYFELNVFRSCWLVSKW